MKASLKILGIGAACAACCALPGAGAFLAGSALAATLSGALQWIALATMVGMVGYWLFRLAPADKAANTSSCGCGSAEKPPIACTLSAGDFKERTTWIRDLARETLREARLEGLTLHLTYAPSAAGRVREMVRKEQACCGFMQFDLRESASGVHLSITAPEDAVEAAHELFAHFAPDTVNFHQTKAKELA
ncbi:hypothetical protein EDE08_109327 [Bradyrhizobium sp. R2.2-H]|uniref:hypothetical protein n=1 Tax=unclassified Bradyrhizobium TaxID=2631580 RepID=UPI00104AB67B|nr:MULTISPECIES: hypothetical protein [unclassified Bradyrhizobium]TCU68274.1 hypothetical protein EDE10_10986 [Bradyrhizobium sp. Y-H1]TCU70104.1 hypothetical protein EDE08_109327 [Bradyrhizobium sp. R2.2-H]